MRLDYTLKKEDCKEFQTLIKSTVFNSLSLILMGKKKHQRKFRALDFCDISDFNKNKENDLKEFINKHKNELCKETLIKINNK